ncbi:hypothetical protein DPMN_087561 [Dreissena polymorpha]|uniref:Uncharacterized protein n=1 Tax=Dreissena polymorpha TaxID=45954 RepID=A0A9D4KSL7_DREPO|nr:hypothetical protein DPMN_087561 [Dreissena polymorpha]
MVGWAQTPSDTSWPRTLGKMLNEFYPQVAATLNLGFQTFLPSVRDYLINKWLIITSSGPEKNVPQLHLSHYISIGHGSPQTVQCQGIKSSTVTLTVHHHSTGDQKPGKPSVEFVLEAFAPAAVIILRFLHLQQTSDAI